MFWNRKKKLPMGSKTQGGLDRFKFKASYNQIDKLFYISLTDRQEPFLTQRLNITTEEFKNILDGMVIAYEDVIHGNTDYRIPDNKKKYQNIP
jgi:hypothetical protein